MEICLKPSLLMNTGLWWTQHSGMVEIPQLAWAFTVS